MVEAWVTVSTLVDHSLARTRSGSVASPYGPAASGFVHNYLNNKVLVPHWDLDAVDPNSIKCCCFYQ